jgi:O-antigen ligase
LLWHAHNVVLNYGLALGIPGMLVLLMVFGALLREYARLWQSDDQGLRLIGACGMVLVLGVFSCNMVNDMFVRDVALLFWALNGMLLGLGRRQLAAGPREAA